MSFTGDLLGPAEPVGETGAHGLVVRQPAGGWVELTAPSRDGYLERISSLLDTLASASMDPSAREDVKFVLNEVASNAMEWGNRKEPRRRVKVSYALFDDEMVLKIEDEGEGFDPAALPDPAVGPVELTRARLREGKRLGGFGIHMVRQLVDKMVYSERGNVCLLSKSFGRERAAGP